MWPFDCRQTEGGKGQMSDFHNFFRIQQKLSLTGLKSKTTCSSNSLSGAICYLGIGEGKWQFLCRSCITFLHKPPLLGLFCAQGSGSPHKSGKLGEGEARQLGLDFFKPGADTAASRVEKSYAWGVVSVDILSGRAAGSEIQVLRGMLSAFLH